MRPRWLSNNVFFLGLTSLCSDTNHEMVTAVLPLFITLELGAGPGVLGLIEGLSDGASSFIKSFSGYLSDRIGRRKPIIDLGYLLTGLTMPIIGLTTSWVQVLLLRLLGWAGRGARGPPRDALLTESTTQDSMGKAFGFERAMDTIGATIGPGLALVLVTYLGYRQVFMISLIPGLAAVMVVVFFVKEVKACSASKSTNTKLRARVGYLSALRSLPKPFKSYLLAVGVFGLGNFANSLFTLRAQEVLAPILGAGRAAVVAVGLYTLLNLVYAACSVPAGALSDRVGRRRVLASGYFISSVTCLLTAFLTGDMLILIITFVSAGFFTAITDTVERAAAADFLPAEMKGIGFGALHTINGIGDFISSTAVGVLWTFTSPFMAFGYAAFLSAMGGMLLLRLSMA